MKKIILSVLILTVAAAVFLPQLYNKISESQDVFSAEADLNAESKNVFDISSGESDGGETASADAAATDADALYVGEYNGKVGIWKNPASKPYIVLDVYTFTLPAFDKSMVQKGFYISSEELEPLICDFTG